MRQGSNNGRRPRGRPNRKHHGPSRSSSFESSGPEGRIRGNASQVYEKYLALARDATSGGDRVAAETFYQHAEHYFRIMNDSTDPQSGQSPGHQASSGTGYGGQDFRGRHRGNGRDGSERPSGDNRPPPPPPPNDPATAPQPDIEALPEGSPAVEIPIQSSAGGDGAETAAPGNPRPRRNQPAKRAADGGGEEPAGDSRPRRGRPPKAKVAAPEEPCAATKEPGSEA